MYDGLLGHRVVLRRRIAVAGGSTDGRQKYADVLGELTDAGDPLRVRTAAGDVVAVARAEVHRIKAIPPAPVRARDALALEEVAALGWPAPDSTWLGRWLLRAAQGWTGRANSVLPLGDPGAPVGEAVEVVQRWYAERDLPARFQIPVPGAAAVEDHLAGVGYDTDTFTVVQAATLAEVSRRTAGSRDLPPVALDPTPSENWLATYHYRGGGALPPVARQVMTAARRPVFASVQEDGTTVAIARAVVDEGWLGVTAVEVTGPHRRRGLGTHVMAALAAWGAANGARDCYLQVMADNAVALAFYDRLGYTTHHHYHYRIARSAAS